MHGLLARDANGRWCPGPQLAVLAAGAPDPLVTASADVLPRLRDRTGESVQVYRPDGLSRICIAVAEPTSGLRDTVQLGSRLPMNAGSGAKVLTAWADPSTQRAVLAEASFTERTLAEVRRRGWAQSVAEREPGVASVSAPVRERRRAPSSPRFRCPGRSSGSAAGRARAGPATWSRPPTR